MFFRTEAKIDLDAVDHNYRRTREIIPSEVKLLCVIKADAYGHGAVEMARLLDERCDFFGVACIEEAIQLKNAGIVKPILILGYVSPAEYVKVVKYDIRIPIFSMDTAKELSAEAVRQNKIVPFHFCIDTGMSRIGYQVCEESADECAQITKLPNIFAEGLFSHYARADEEDLSKSRIQRGKFESFVEMLSKRGVEIPIKHMNNSAGIMNFSENFDMCRMGIILYGLYPSNQVDKTTLDLKPVMTWTATISHIKRLEANREISYGGTHVTKEERVIATVPVGYADGYPRCLSNVGRVLVGGEYAPIVGRVCMDQFMIDITDIQNVKVQDEVVLVGKQGNNELSMEEVSNLAHSFNYELPCRVGTRVPRTYYRNGKLIKHTNYLY